MQSTLLDDALSLALDLSQQAADVVSAQGMPSSVSRKADGSLLTDTDQHIERLILDAVCRRFPAHGFLGEESVGGRGGRGR